VEEIIKDNKFRKSWKVMESGLFGEACGGVFGKFV
jgi:hypothetical protein